MRRFNLRHVDFDAEARSLWNEHRAFDDFQWLLCQSLTILPNPMRIDCSDVTWSRGRDMGEHSKRDVEVIILMRSPGEAPIPSHLRNPDGSLQRPEMQIGKWNID